MVNNLIYQSKAPTVARRLAKDIEWGKFSSGTLLPSDQALAKEYSVSRMTMRKVLTILAEEGQVVKLPQKGVLVPQRKEGREAQGDGRKSDSLQTSRRVTIAAVWAAEPDAHLVGIGEGVKKYAGENEFQLQMMLSPNGHERAMDVLRNVERYRLDGIILMPYGMENYFSAVKRLGEKGFPVVCLGRLVNDIWSGSVDHDNAAGIYRATQYLIEKYNRPVHMIASPTIHQTCVDRYMGYCRAMEDAGYESLIEQYTLRLDVTEYDPTYWPMGKKYLPGFMAGERLLEKAECPISVVCNNDYIALGVYESVKKRGLVVGKDVAVVGFDDIPVAARAIPPLTTVRQVPVNTGYFAARLLHQIILGEIKSPEAIHLPAELIVRESA
jgi:DNA-binding LacI/PurR family transcriptional regulator